MHEKVKINFLFEFPLNQAFFADQKDVQTSATCQHIIKLQYGEIGTVPLNLLLGNLTCWVTALKALSPKLRLFRSVSAINNMAYLFH